MNPQVHVPQPYPVEKIVEKKVPYPVEKIVEKRVRSKRSLMTFISIFIRQVPYPVVKEIEVPR